MPEMHLWQPGNTYSACQQFTKNKERIQKFKGIEDSQYVYQNKLDKASDKILCDKAFNITKNPKLAKVSKKSCFNVL